MIIDEMEIKPEENYTIDPLFFVNVLNHVNVDEYSQPYVVISLLDVNLFGREIFFIAQSLGISYRHHLKT